MKMLGKFDLATWGSKADRRWGKDKRRRKRIEARCRHGIPTTDPDAASCAWYEDPEHIQPAGPAHRPSNRHSNDD